MWFWLAKIVRGRSQHVKTRRGVDRGSRAIRALSFDHPASAELLSQERLTEAIRRLCSRAEGQSHLCGVSQMVGMSIIVGTKTFSTAVGLGFSGGLSRVSGRLQRAGRGRR